MLLFFWSDPLTPFFHFRGFPSDTMNQDMNYYHLAQLAPYKVTYSTAALAVRASDLQKTLRIFFGRELLFYNPISRITFVTHPGVNFDRSGRITSNSPSRYS